LPDGVWPGLPYLLKRLKGLPGDTPVAVHPWVPLDAESSGQVPGYLVAAADLHLPEVPLPPDDDPTSPPPPPPPPPVVETWYVAVSARDKLNLRDRAGTKGTKVIGKLPRGMQLKIRGRFLVDEIMWTEVLEPVQGFTAVDYLSLVPPDLPPEPPPPPPVEKMFVNVEADSWLNVRDKPGTTSTQVIGKVFRGDELEIQGREDADGLTWTKVLKPVIGYVAVKHLSATKPEPAPVPLPPDPVPPAPPPPPATRISSPIGLHVMSWVDVQGLFNLMRTLDQANKPLSGVTLTWSAGVIPTVTELKTVSPKTPICLRVYEPDPDIAWQVTALRNHGYTYAMRYYQEHLALNPDWLKAEYHQIINEQPMSHELYTRGVTAWWEGALDAADKVGIGLAVLCFTSGQPALPEDVNKPNHDFWQRDDVLALLRRVLASKGKHILMLHQYLLGSTWTDTWAIARHKRIYAALPADLKKLPLWIGEYGDGSLLRNGHAAFIRGLAEAEPLLDDFIVTASIWSAGANSDRWKDDKVDAAFPALTTHLLSR
jgi:hypothetical protein